MTQQATGCLERIKREEKVYTKEKEDWNEAEVKREIIKKIEKEMKNKKVMSKKEATRQSYFEVVTMIQFKHEMVSTKVPRLSLKRNKL